MNRDVEQFEKCWNIFLTRLEGRMMTQSKKQTLTYPFLNLMLSDACLCWGSEYEEGGRWLKKYSEAEPEKGKLIRQILMEEMRFSEISVKKDTADSWSYAIPIAGAAAGLGISHVLKAGMAAQAASTILPVVILYPSVKAAGENRSARMKKGMMKEYLSQLDKYRLRVASLLED